MEQEPLRFSNEQKLRKQMRKRRIDEAMIRRALETTLEAWRGKHGPAKRYRDPISGAWVMVDGVTGAIFHVGTARFKDDDA